MKRGILLQILALFLLSACNSASPTIRSIDIPKPNPPIVITRITTSTSFLTISPIANATTSANIGSQDLATMISTNGGCRLPCVWSFIPGQTSRNEIDKAFSFFKANSHQDMRIGYDPNYCLLTLKKINDNIENQIILSCKEKSNTANIISFSAFSFTGDHQKELFGGIEFKKITAYFSISNILNIYGLPEKILIGSWKQDPMLHSQYDPFITVLDYDKQGFIVQYLSPATYEGEFIKGCPQEGNIELVAWDTSNPPDKDTRLNWLGGIGINSLNYSTFQDLDQFHTLSKVEFLEIFKLPDNSECVVIPNPDF